jgi:DnaJ-class molecular chaperone
VLANAEKRKLYDMYGKAGVEGGGGAGRGGMDPEEMANMFGGQWFNLFQNQRRCGYHACEEREERLAADSLCLVV